MKDSKVSEPKSRLIHLDQEDLAVISPALGSGTARELSLIPVTANGTELGWKWCPVLLAWVCTPAIHIKVQGGLACDAELH